jgi:hypothetical protein
MIKKVSHNRSDEEIDAKTRWFRSLSFAERMDLLCEFTDMILNVNPRIAEKRYAQPVAGRILVLAQPRR